MWPDIYNFFEQFCGVSYDFTEDISNIKGDIAFVEPYSWQTGVNRILDDVQEALDKIDEFKDFLTDEMPTPDEMKRTIAVYVLGEMVGILNSLKQSLHIDKTDIDSFDSLEQQYFVIGKLIEMLSTHSLDELLSENLFDTYIVEDEEDENLFVSLFGLHSNDVPNMSMTVDMIKEEYYESLEEDE